MIPRPFGSETSKPGWMKIISTRFLLPLEQLLGVRSLETGILDCPLVKKRHYLGYGFIEFSAHECAEQVLQLYNGTPIAGLNKNYRLNWGSHCGGITRANGAASGYGSSTGGGGNNFASGGGNGKTQEYSVFFE